MELNHGSDKDLSVFKNKMIKNYLYKRRFSFFTNPKYY